MVPISQDDSLPNEHIYVESKKTSPMKMLRALSDSQKVNNAANLQKLSKQELIFKVIGLTYEIDQLN